MANKVIESCKIFQKQLESDIAAGNKWQYRNPSKYLNEQWKKALKKNKRACNCALLARWALKEAGIIPQSTGIFYGNAGTIQWSAVTKSTVTKTCDVINAGGKTVDELIKNKTLKAGDIVMYKDFRHTNIYAGNRKWYDAGHAYCSGSGEGAIFKSWYGNEVYKTSKVSHIIRPKEPDTPDTSTPATITPAAKKEYFVQAGSFTTKKAAKAHAKEIKAKKFDAIVKKGSDKQYKVQCGKFSSKANAKVLKESLEDAGFDAVIKTAL